MTDLPLVSGKALADALGVTPAAVSAAASEERPCEGWPVHEWVRRKPDGSARGYAVPIGAREKLGLPAGEEKPEQGPENRSSSGETGAAASVEGSPSEERLSEEHLSEEALDRVAREVVTGIAARVAWSIYQEMGPLLREVIRTRMGDGTQVAESSMGDSQTGDSQGGDGPGRADGEEARATEKPPDEAERSESGFLEEKYGDGGGPEEKEAEELGELIPFDPGALGS